MPRYTIDFGEDFDKLLTDLATTKSMTKAEVIRRAVALYAFLNRQLASEQDMQLSITRDGHILKDIAIP
jgi:hypothetical protein